MRPTTEPVTLYACCFVEDGGGKFEEGVEIVEKQRRGLPGRDKDDTDTLLVRARRLLANDAVYNDEKVQQCAIQHTVYIPVYIKGVHACYMVN